MALEKQLCVKIPKKEGQAAREKLIHLSLLDFTHKPKSLRNYIYFPVIAKPRDYKTTKTTVEKRELKPTSIKEVLKNTLNEEEINHLISSFDTIGDIAIIELAKKLKKKQATIAQALVKVNKNIKVVLAKEGKRKGVFRLRKLKYLFGEKRTITTHKENKCLFKLDVAKAYFSPRLVFERDRVAKLTKPNENIIVMFAGVGPFAIIIAKSNPSSTIHTIELNPYAFKYMKENIILNKCSNIIPVFGDVRKIIPKNFISSADRILMPLPKGAEEFLKEAFLAAKKDCIVHLYTFADENDPFSRVVGKIEKEAKVIGKKIKILNKRIVKPYAPYAVQIVIDFLVK